MARYKTLKKEYRNQPHVGRQTKTKLAHFTTSLSMNSPN